MIIAKKINYYINDIFGIPLSHNMLYISEKLLIRLHC
jgi:hypothetical protein